MNDLIFFIFSEVGKLSLALAHSLVNNCEIHPSSNMVWGGL